MNREEQIERFRNEKLQEYIKLAENEPYIPPKIIQPIDDKPFGYYATKYRKCRKCGEVRPVTDFAGEHRMCRECQNKRILGNYNKERIIKSLKKKNVDVKKCSKCGKEILDSETYGRYKMCKACKMKYQMQRYYNKRVEYYKDKLQDVS